MGLLASIINYAVNILSMIIVLRVIISWLAPYTRNDFTEVIYAITEPMFVPFRRLFPMGYSRIDISPMLAYFTLYLIRKILFIIIF